MGDPTIEEFETWAHPSDVIEWYHEQRVLKPRSYVVGLLEDGFLRAAAHQFVLGGQDYGLAVIPAALWPEASKTDVWVTGRFRIKWFHQGSMVVVSADDVRIDRQPRQLPAPNPNRPPTSVVARAEPKRGGRPAGKNGEPIARVTMRLLQMPETDLATCTAEAVASYLIEEYQHLGLQSPNIDNARRDAAGILRAVRN